MRSLIPAFLITAVVFIFSCTKIDSTVLGSDLIPAVDNINTFDTIIDVVTTNMIQNDDTTKISYANPLAVGQTNDPLFGKSEASLSFEMKPVNFSAAALSINLRDSLIGGNNGIIDSTVLCLRYVTGFGDVSTPVTFSVYMLTEKFKDTALYSIKDAPPQASLTSVGSKSISLKSLGTDSIPVYRSSTLSYKTIRQLRIPITGVDWLTVLKDTNKLKTDSGFRTVVKGFALKIQPVAGAGAMAYFNIADTASRLEFYYRRNPGSTVKDTTSTSFYFNPNNSGYANHISWERGSSEIAGHLNPTAIDSFVYIKTTPGTATRIRIPGLTSVSNRIVHRAELKMYQIPDNPVTDSQLVVPPLLYLERFEPGNIAFNKYQTIPIDLNPNTPYGDCFPANTGIDYAYFGGFPQNELVNGVIMKAYTFNISRYVQQVITKKLTNADLRLSSNLFSQYDGCGLGTAPIPVTSNPIAYGRVKLGGSITAGKNLPYKMRLRIIYSKL